jgi:DNA-binding response OmpR family regulator
MSTKIAMIDDSTVALDWAKGALAPHGFDVATYNESLGIQSFVRRAQPRLVLLDVNMPAMNGGQVCRLLKTNAQTRDVIVALYSSLPENELKALASSCGADGYVVKSEDAKVLVQQLNILLGKKP